MLDYEDKVLIDPREYPDLYKPAYSEGGTDTFSVCGNCEVEQFGRKKMYMPGTAVSHGICPRHQEEMRAEMRRYTPQRAATPAKATFWPTSGSGA